MKWINRNLDFIARYFFKIDKLHIKIMNRGFYYESF